MMQTYVKNILEDFCSLFGKSVEAVHFENEKIPGVQIKGNPSLLHGIRNIVHAVTNVGSENTEQSALEDQWIEYALTHVAFLQNSSNLLHILKELNEYLCDKVYFVGHKQTPVDVLMYLLIYDVMYTFTFQEKEKYINVSRWFDCIQQDRRLARKRSPICFSKTRLYV